MQLNYSGVIVRLVLRILFIVLFLYLGFLGKLCNKLSRKHRLLKYRSIPISKTGGWFGLGGLYDGVWALRRIPDAKWWLLMLAIGGLSKLADLATTAVQQEYLHSFCDFGTGMVLSLDARDAFGIPPFNGRPQLVAGTAQQTSLNNGCSKGIYRKVNEDPLFCAAQRDILGTWSCQSVGEDITYRHGTNTWEDIAKDLLNRELIYASAAAELTNTSHSYDFSHLVILSSSTYDGSGEVFDIKASIDRSSGNDDDKVMHSMFCKMEAPEADKIASQIPVESTMNVWIILAQGYMYEGHNSPAVPDPEGTLAWYLNTLIMVAGSSDVLLSDAPIDDPTQGCLALTTIIPTWLIAILSLTVLSCVLISMLALFTWVQVRRDDQRADVENAPVDVWTWIAQAVAESNAREDGSIPIVRPRDLENWSIVRANGTVRIGKHEEEMQPLSG